MAARIKTELAVGVTQEIKDALEIATEFQGMKPSQYGRQAILEKLVRDGYLKHPGLARLGNNTMPKVAAE
jgi:hypothetical protein